MGVIFSQESIAKSCGGKSNAYKFKLEVIENSTNIANNTSNVTINHYGAGYNSSWTFKQFTSPRSTVNIDGSDKASGQVTEITSTSYKLLSTWTGNITHNSDGNKAISFSGTFAPNTSSYSYLPASNTISGSANLSYIPRYTSISSFTVSKRSGYAGITSVKVDWKTADTIDYLWYSKDNGANWTGYDVSDGTSGSFNITGLSANSGYNFKIRVRRKDSQLTTDSGTYYQTTYDINRITSGKPNVSNGSSLRVTGSSASGASCRIRIECGNASRLSLNGKDCTFSVDNINSLMQYFTTSKTFTIRAVVCTLDDNGNEQYWDWQDGTYTITNSNPTFSNFSFFDSDSSIVSLTGSNTYLVKNKSTLRVSIPAANKMSAKNYASASSYRIEVAGLTGTLAYSSNDTYIDMGKINIAGALNLSVSAIDSRGFITTVTKTIYIIDYATPSLIPAIQRLNGFEKTTKIDVTGTFHLITCGTENKNTINSVKYRYKESTASSWGSWKSLPFTINNNVYTCTQQVLELDNEKSFNFELQVVDKLETLNMSFFLSQGIPIEFINATRKNVGIGCMNDNEEYSLAVRGNIYLKSGHAVLDYEVVAEWE